MNYRWLAGLRNLFHRTQADHDLDAEISAHVEMLTDENLARGLAPEAARFPGLR